MDSAPPILLANRVIRQLSDNLLGKDLVILPQDYIELRTAFKKRGGSWYELSNGNITHLNMLVKILTTWGQLPNRKRHTELG